MRLLRSRYSDRLRGELHLLLADSVARMTAIVFASGLLDRSDQTLDAVLLGVWASIPRGVAVFFDRLVSQTGFLKSFLCSLGTGLLTLLLIGSGLTLLLPETSRTPLAESLCIFLIFCAWGAGFLVLFPRCYLLHDLLLCGVLTVGLIFRESHALLCVGVFLAALLYSASVRHQLHEIFWGVSRPHLNLQNAAVLSVGGAFAGAALFASVGAVAPQRPPRPVPGKSVEVVGGLLTGESPGERIEAPGAGGRETSDGDEGEAGARGGGTVGYTNRVGLGRLHRPKYDERIVFSARFPDEAPRLRSGALWKVATLTTFDPGEEQWQATARSVTAVDPAEIAFEEEGVPALPWPLRIEIHGFLGTNLVRPYFAGGVQDLHPEPERVQGSELGDLAVSAPLESGSRYTVLVRPHHGGLEPEGAGSAPHPDPRYLEVPAPASVGLDLEAEAQRIFTPGGGIPRRLRELRQFFESRFRYSDTAFWVQGDRRLADFLELGRVGNCEYFATATALLLRAGGVSTRVSAGFLGYEWRDGRYWVRNSDAHLWVEVYLSDWGWLPVDPSRWVEVDPASTRRPARRTGLQAERTGEGESGDGTSGESAGAERRNPAPPRPEEEAASRADVEEAAGAPSPAARRPPEEQGEASQQSGGRTEEPGWIESEAGPASDEPPSAGASDDRPPGADVREGEGRSSELSGSGFRPSRGGGDVAGSSHSLPTWQGFFVRGVGAAIFRVLLLIVTAAAAGLVVYSFRRPRADEEEKDEPRESSRGAEPWRPEAFPTVDEGFLPTSAGEHVLWEYVRLQEDLAEVRRHRRLWETPREHQVRLRGRHSGLDEALSSLNRLVYSVLYGEEELESHHAEEARDLCRKIRAAVR